jgi:large subunit ribosomal protein L15
MRLHEVNKDVVKHKKTLRLGRGVGTGQGKTAGRGHKGQKSHAGFSQPPAFQGGMSPLVRRVPKRGFFNDGALIVGSVNVGDLNDFYNEGEEVNRQSLKDKNLLKGRYDVLKILGTGEITKKLNVATHRMSASAKVKLESAGCTIELLKEKIPVAEKQAAAKAAKASKKK